jgi:SAM-dependent methyltransferase
LSLQASIASTGLPLFLKASLSMSARPHPESWIAPDELGTRIPPFRPTFGFETFINGPHRDYATCPLQGDCIDLGIPGWLRREDALKLYELAYFSTGEILEVGSFHGLSTSILARAVKDSGNGRTITTIELEPAHLHLTRRSLADRQLHDIVTTLCGPAERWLPRLAREGRTFGFVFLDHAHTYEATRGACESLPQLLSPGGFCLFHDFNDARNNDPGDPEYAVAGAVIDSLPAHSFAFYGIYGCSALYRKHPA